MALPYHMISALCLLIAVYFSYHTPRKDPWTITTVGNRELSFAAPQSKDVISTSTDFPFVLPTIGDEVLLRFYFRCQKPCQQVWVTFPVIDPVSPPLEILAFHSLFETLTYSHISSNSLWLYQKEYTFQTIEAFINSPPSQSMSEPYVIYRFQLPAQSINEVGAIMPDYILTTYQQPRIFGEYLEFSRTVTVTGLTLTNNELKGIIRHEPPQTLLMLTKPTHEITSSR